MMMNSSKYPSIPPPKGRLRPEVIKIIFLLLFPWTFGIVGMGVVEGRGGRPWPPEISKPLSDPGPSQTQNPAVGDPEAQKTKIEITVVDWTGEPTENAAVLIADGTPNLKPGQDPYFALTGSRWLRQVTTDKRGQVLSPPLYPGPYLLMALPPGGTLSDGKGQIGSVAKVVHALLDQTIRCSLALRKGGRIEGQVLDDAKKPLPGTPILLQGAGFSHRTSAGAEGVFLFQGLYPGRYDLQPGGQADLPLTGIAQKVEIKEGGKATATVTATPMGTLLVYLIQNLKDRPAPELTLTLVEAPAGPQPEPGGKEKENPRPAVETLEEKARADGLRISSAKERKLVVPAGTASAHFKDLPPGPYLLSAMVPEGFQIEPVRTEVYVKGGRFTTVRLALSQAQAVSPPPPPPLATDALLRLKALRDGKIPLPGVGFAAIEKASGKTVAKVKTGQDGVAEVKVQAGEWRIEVEVGSGWKATPLNLTLTVKAQETVEKVFEVKPPPSWEF